jgi:ligand-binding SRPBCC domain-containing protein
MHIFQRTQFIPGNPEKIWAFFSTPENLEKIMPVSMAMKIITLPKGSIYPGMIITYRLKPFHGISINWMTEITQVKAPLYFVDDQRYGPYKIWHHEHHFKTVKNGSKMTDIIHYVLPGGPLGKALNHLLVSDRLETIFDFRKYQVEDIFGKRNE